MMEMIVFFLYLLYLPSLFNGKPTENIINNHIKSLHIPKAIKSHSFKQNSNTEVFTDNENTQEIKKEENNKINTTKNSELQFVKQQSVKQQSVKQQKEKSASDIDIDIDIDIEPKKKSYQTIKHHSILENNNKNNPSSVFINTDKQYPESVAHLKLNFPSTFQKNVSVEKRNKRKQNNQTDFKLINNQKPVSHLELSQIEDLTRKQILEKYGWYSETIDKVYDELKTKIDYMKSVYTFFKTNMEYFITIDVEFIQTPPIKELVALENDFNQLEKSIIQLHDQDTIINKYILTNTRLFMSMIPMIRPYNLDKGITDRIFSRPRIHPMMSTLRKIVNTGYNAAKALVLRSAQIGNVLIESMNIMKQQVNEMENVLEKEQKEHLQLIEDATQKYEEAKQTREKWVSYNFSHIPEASLQQVLLSSNVSEVTEHFHEIKKLAMKIEQHYETFKQATQKNKTFQAIPFTQSADHTELEEKLKNIYNSFNEITKLNKEQVVPVPELRKEDIKKIRKLKEELDISMNKVLENYTKLKEFQRIQENKTTELKNTLAKTVFELKSLKTIIEKNKKEVETNKNKYIMLYNELSTFNDPYVTEQILINNEHIEREKETIMHIKQQDIENNLKEINSYIIRMDEFEDPNITYDMLLRQVEESNKTLQKANVDKKKTENSLQQIETFENHINEHYNSIMKSILEKANVEIPQNISKVEQHQESIKTHMENMKQQKELLKQLKLKTDNRNETLLKQVNPIMPTELYKQNIHEEVKTIEQNIRQISTNIKEQINDIENIHASFEKNYNIFKKIHDAAVQKSDKKEIAQSLNTMMENIKKQNVTKNIEQIKQENSELDTDISNLSEYLKKKEIVSNGLKELNKIARKSIKYKNLVIEETEILNTLSSQLEDIKHKITQHTNTHTNTQTNTHTQIDIELFLENTKKIKELEININENTTQMSTISVTFAKLAVEVEALKKTCNESQTEEDATTILQQIADKTKEAKNNSNEMKSISVENKNINKQVEALLISYIKKYKTLYGNILIELSNDIQKHMDLGIKQITETESNNLKIEYADVTKQIKNKINKTSIETLIQDSVHIIQEATAKREEIQKQKSELDKAMSEFEHIEMQETLYDEIPELEKSILKIEATMHQLKENIIKENLQINNIKLRFDEKKKECEILIANILMNQIKEEISKAEITLNNISKEGKNIDEIKTKHPSAVTAVSSVLSFDYTKLLQDIEQQKQHIETTLEEINNLDGQLKADTNNKEVTNIRKQIEQQNQGLQPILTAINYKNAEIESMTYSITETNKQDILDFIKTETTSAETLNTEIQNQKKDTQLEKEKSELLLENSRQIKTQPDDSIDEAIIQRNVETVKSLLEQMKNKKISISENSLKATTSQQIIKAHCNDVSMTIEKMKNIYGHLSNVDNTVKEENTKNANIEEQKCQKYVTESTLFLDDIKENERIIDEHISEVTIQLQVLVMEAEKTKIKNAVEASKVLEKKINDIYDSTIKIFNETITNITESTNNKGIGILYEEYNIDEVKNARDRVNTLIENISLLKQKCDKKKQELSGIMQKVHLAIKNVTENEKEAKEKKETEIKEISQNLKNIDESTKSLIQYVEQMEEKQIEGKTLEEIYNIEVASMEKLKKLYFIEIVKLISNQVQSERIYMEQKTDTLQKLVNKNLEFFTTINIPLATSDKTQCEVMLEETLQLMAKGKMLNEQATDIKKSSKKQTTSEQTEAHIANVLQRKKNIETLKEEIDTRLLKTNNLLHTMIKKQIDSYTTEITNEKKKMDSIQSNIKTNYEELQKQFAKIKTINDKDIIDQEISSAVTKKNSIDNLIMQYEQQLTKLKKQQDNLNQITQHFISELTEDMSEEVEKKVEEGVPEEIPEKVSEEISEEISKEISKEIPEEIPEKIPEEVSAEISEKLPEKISNRKKTDEAQKLAKLIIQQLEKYADNIKDKREQITTAFAAVAEHHKKVVLTDEAYKIYSKSMDIQKDALNFLENFQKIYSKIESARVTNFTKNMEYVKQNEKLQNILQEIDNYKSESEHIMTELVKSNEDSKIREMAFKLDTLKGEMNKKEIITSQEVEDIKNKLNEIKTNLSENYKILAKIEIQLNSNLYQINENQKQYANTVAEELSRSAKQKIHEIKIMNTDINHLNTSIQKHKEEIMKSAKITSEETIKEITAVSEQSLTHLTNGIRLFSEATGKYVDIYEAFITVNKSTDDDTLLENLNNLVSLNNQMLELKEQVVTHITKMNLLNLKSIDLHLYNELTKVKRIQVLKDEERNNISIDAQDMQNITKNLDGIKKQLGFVLSTDEDEAFELAKQKYQDIENIQSRTKKIENLQKKYASNYEEFQQQCEQSVKVANGLHIQLKQIQFKIYPYLEETENQQLRNYMDTKKKTCYRC